MKRRPSAFFWSCAWVALLLAVWLLENFVGERTGATALLTYLPQHGWGVLPLVLLLSSVLKKRPKLALLNGAAFGFWGFCLLGFQLPAPRFDQPKTLRVVTYNVLGGKADAAQIARDIQKERPDIVCLQESQNGFGERVAAHFHGWTSKSLGDISTMSRFPLVSTQIHSQLGRKRLIETVWQTPLGRVRVHSVHISFQPRGTKSRSRFALVRFLDDNRRRAGARLDQISDIEALPRDGMPTLLCGDFNTPPRGLFYRAIARHWNDAFAQSGFGLGQSYPAVLPLLRIDYVWMRGLRSTSARIGDAGGSDHRPLVCDIALE